MQTATKSVQEIKAKLFELSHLIETHHRPFIMEQFCKRIASVLAADRVVCTMFNGWRHRGKLRSFYSSEPAKQEESLSLQHFEQLYAKEENVFHDEAANVYIKIDVNHRTKGFLIITAAKKELSTLALNEMRVSIQQFLLHFYEQRHKRFLKYRNNQLIDLSIDLHHLHETKEVIRSIYTSMQEMYPYFNYTLLLTQEYEMDDVPTQLLRFDQTNNEEKAIAAFIQNELQVDYRTAEGEVHIYTPLSGKQAVYGVIHVSMKHLVDPEEMELDVIRKFSNMAGRVIERTTLFQTSNRQLADLQTINAASQTLNRNLKQCDIIMTVQRFILDTSNAEEVGIVTFADMDIHTGTYTILSNSTAYFNTDKGKQLIQEFMKQLSQHPYEILKGNFTIEQPNSVYHSLMVIPMWNAATVFGFIIALHPLPYYFSLDKFKMIQSFIQHASLAFQNSVLQEQLQVMATTDYLTKLYSRSHLDKMVLTHMEADQKGVFVLFDIDDFKAINDEHGHFIGDQVLVQVAEMIRAAIHPIGIAARWGGEEFAVFFPNQEIGAVMPTVDLIRRTVMEKTNPQISLSSGIALWNEHYLVTSIQQLFILADEALYEAKAAGKNRIVQKIQ